MSKICTTLRLKQTGEAVPVTLDPATVGPVTGAEIAAGRQVEAAVIDAQIVDVSVVEDGHEFGLDADGLLHVEGRIVAPEVRIEPGGE